MESTMNTPHERVQSNSSSAEHSNGGNFKEDFHHPADKCQHSSCPSVYTHTRRRNVLDINPVALGMLSISTPLLLKSLLDVHARGINEQNILVGTALGIGFLGTLLAAIYAAIIGNTFAFTNFTVYSGFWLSYGILLLPGSAGITGNPQSFGQYWIVWWVTTSILWIASVRKSIGAFIFFFFLWMNYLLLACGNYTSGQSDSSSILIAASWFGIIAGVVGYFLAIAELFTKKEGFIDIPVGSTAPAKHDDKK